MFCLGKQIRGNKTGIGSLIRDHQDLTGTRDRVNAGHAETGFLGKGHINIAGTCDLIGLWNGLCAISHGRDGLGSAGLVDFRRARNVGSHHAASRYFSVRTGRRDHNDLLNAGYFGRHDIHQNAGGIDRPAAGHITARHLDRGDLLSQDDAVLTGRDPAVDLLLLVIDTDSAALRITSTNAGSRLS